MNKYLINQYQLHRIDMTNRELAKRTGYCEEYISQMIHGRAVSKKCAISVANTVLCDLEELFKKI